MGAEGEENQSLSLAGEEMTDIAHIKWKHISWMPTQDFCKVCGKPAAYVRLLSCDGEVSSEEYLCSEHFHERKEKMEEKKEEKIVVSSDKDIFEATQRIQKYLDDIPFDVEERRLHDNMRTMKNLLHAIQECLKKRGKEYNDEIAESQRETIRQMKEMDRKCLENMRREVASATDVQGWGLTSEDAKSLLIDTAEATLCLGDALRKFFRDKEEMMPESLMPIASNLNRIEASLLRLKGIRHSPG